MYQVLITTIGNPTSPTPAVATSIVEFDNRADALVAIKIVNDRNKILMANDTKVTQNALALWN